MATRSLTCYATPGKEKSRRLLEAFAAGVPGGAAVLETPPARLAEGAAAFYGVVPATAHLWAQAKAEGRDWYYIDNAYFDCVRGRYFRVTKNALQADGLGRRSWERLARMPIGMQPWKKHGRHVVIVRQSDEFMRTVCGIDPHAWLEQVLRTLRMHTDRMLVVRQWRRDKDEAARDLAEELAGAWALVTHASAAANEALIAGVPVFCTGACAASAMGLSDLAEIERPVRPERRMEWAASLAACQWTEHEMHDGWTWEALSR